MSIHDHFRRDEQPFVDQVLDWKQYVIDRYAPKLTDFLDPREQEIVRSIIGNGPDVYVVFSGGNEDTERKRAFILPPYIEVTDDDFELAIYHVHYPKKFITLEHRHVLGALMNIGLRREKFGDIVVNDGQIQFVVAEDVAQFVEMNLTAISKASVRLDRIDVSKMIEQSSKYSENVMTVSSLRADAVVSEIYRLSRAKVKPLFDKERVKVNWKVVDQASYQMGVGDVLSVRGQGRSKLLGIEGETKKGKLLIRVGIQQ
ncbi:RNA-binding protein [Texcoconibacillus texcoconensis]|uniref:RNA-binding protein YlmH n=1 Tax=Texcoconibacillus texcoconensis TaxID=1095777 RepID=A0A840QLC4_9BACI|nr:RNA-binding protein [Texcoconibacillus texcoconensis]MBB5172156.1 RNA-binding protein YlmH [Texcoconibacillus texcoconensis]